MTSFEPSRRGTEAPSSPIRRLATLGDDAVSRGITVHYLNIGQPDIPTPTGVVDAYKNYDETVIAYGPSDGFLRLREGLAKYYANLLGTPLVEPNDIIITTGGSEALLFTFAATCDPGDEVLVCEPYYTNYAGFAHILSLNVKPVTTTASNGFRIDIDQVEAGITDRTRVLTIPSPGNPTGLVLSKEELQALSDLCRRHGVFYVSDEVYRDFIYNQPPGTRAPSALSCEGPLDHIVLIDSVSKRYSACGSRIGWLVTSNKAIRDAALNFGQARLCSATVDQHAALAALDTPESYFTTVREEYHKRRDLLLERLDAIGVKCAKPDGAFYLAAALPVEDAEDFCHFLLKDFSHDGETVMLSPMTGFYSTPGLGKNEVRIAYVLETEKLDRCVDILEAGLEAYQSRTSA